jgi:hypothetical protein
LTIDIVTTVLFWSLTKGAFVSDNVIIQAILELAEAIESANCEKEIQETRVSNRQSAVPVGHPIGTTLYKFDYEDGIEALVVTGEKQFGDRSKQWCQPSDLELLAMTPESAIQKAIAYWSDSDEFDIDSDIESMRWEVQYHQEKAAAFGMMLDALLAMKGKA